MEREFLSREYGFLVDSEAMATDIAQKISAFGIQVETEGDCIIINTTNRRYETIKKLMDFWTGIRNEWWYEGRVFSGYGIDMPSTWERWQDGSAPYMKSVVQFWADKYNRKRRHIKQGKRIEIG